MWPGNPVWQNTNLAAGFLLLPLPPQSVFLHKVNRVITSSYIWVLNQPRIPFSLRIKSKLLTVAYPLQYLLAHRTLLPYPLSPLTHPTPVTSASLMLLKKQKWSYLRAMHLLLPLSEMLLSSHPYQLFPHFLQDIISEIIHDCPK